LKQATRRSWLDDAASGLTLAWVTARHVAAAGVVAAALAWTPSARAASCADLATWLAKGCKRLVDTYEQGDNGILLSGYAWHLPYSWTPEKRAEENSDAWGGGLVRTVEDPDGDSHSVFFLAFEDSHRNIQFNVGYEHSTYWGPRSGLQGGLGYTVMIIQRPDIASGVPVPVVLPLFSLRVQDATLYTTYIPTLGGGVNNGSVLYVFGRVVFR